MNAHSNEHLARASMTDEIMTASERRSHKPNRAADLRTTWRLGRRGRHDTFDSPYPCCGKITENLKEIGDRLDILLTITDRISVPPVRYSTENMSFVSKYFTVFVG